MAIFVGATDMGLRGSKGKPAHVKLLEGNPGQRPVKTDFVEPSGDAEPGDYISGYAREVWDRVVAAMPPGTYKATDTGTLEAYCIACDQLYTAQTMLKLEGHVIVPMLVAKDEHGEMIFNDDTGLPVLVPMGKAYRNPWSVVAREAMEKIATLGTRLGLDPIARENIKNPTAQKPASKFAGLVGINGGKA